MTDKTQTISKISVYHPINDYPTVAIIRQYPSGIQWRLYRLDTPSKMRHFYNTIAMVQITQFEHKQFMLNPSYALDVWSNEDGVPEVSYHWHVTNRPEKEDK